jgi:flagellar motor switch protein FliM
MAEVLSQKEIDLLLNKVKSGDEPRLPENLDSEITPYDFRLPNRISKNQLRTITNIHEAFAESFASFLVSKLQTVVNIQVTAVDQIYYSEYILSVSTPGCLFTFDIENTDIKGIFELSNELAITFVDRLLGGNGNGVKQSNVITPIEQNVLYVVVERIMKDLNKSWLSVDDLNFKIDRFEADIDFAQITSQSESILLISFEVKIGEVAYLMNLAFATFSFDPILTKLSSQRSAVARNIKAKSDLNKDIITSQLAHVLLPLKVRFGTSKISMQELMELNEGDILMLENKISDENEVMVGSKPMFLGRSGIVNKHKAIKISRKINNKDNQ